MSLKAYNIDVPITPGVMPPVIHIGQYDSGRDYICHLKNDDGTDYTIPSGTTATFTGCNPRKEVFELEATVDTSANTITITPQDEATSMFGKYGATINLFLNDEQMSPIVILMDVQKAGATDEEIAGAANFPDAVTEAVNDWLEENVEAGQLGSLYVPQAAQAEKTDAMTQPVGIDGNGKLWTTPGEGGGSTEGAVLYNQSQSLTSTQKSQARSNIGAGTYSKAPGGIPATDMAQAVQTALTAAGTAVQPAALADYITKAAQGTKLSTDTVPVKIDANGKLWVAGGGESVQEVMIVTITRNGSTYTSDTTDDDIVAAAANGMLIMAQTPITGGFAYYSYEDEGAIFYGISGDSQSSTFNISRYSVEGTSVTVTEQDVTPMVVTVTSGSGGAYTTDTDEATILAAVAAGREVIANALGHRFYFMDSDNGATFFSIIGTGTTRAILRLVIDGTNVTVEGIVPVNAGLITPKTAAMTQAVGYRASDGTLWTVPGSGPNVPTPTSSDNGKYLGVVNGAYALRSAPSGGGVDIYSVEFVYSSGYWYIQHDGTDIAAEDIFTALFDGDIVQVKDDAGAECELIAINYSPDEGRLVYKSCNMDNGVPEWRIFTIQDEIVQGDPRAEVTMAPVDLLPLTDSRTASAVASGFTVDGNTVYTVSGTISGFALSTNALPTMLPGQCIEIRLTVGSTDITTATWPSWANLLNGWDGNFAANTYYKIMIDDAGNVVAGTREVSA